MACLKTYVIQYFCTFPVQYKKKKLFKIDIKISFLHWSLIHYILLIKKEKKLWLAMTSKLGISTIKQCNMFYKMEFSLAIHFISIIYLNTKTKDTILLSMPIQSVLSSKYFFEWTLLPRLHFCQNSRYLQLM